MSNESEIVVRYEIDREGVWEKIKNRKVVFLDSNIWINMADGKPEAQSLKVKLQDRVRAGAVFCPLSAPLIWELYKQEFSELRTGALMEELSLNVTFVQEREVYQWEVERFAKCLAKQEDDRCPHKRLFAPALAYLTSAFTLAFPINTPDEMIQKMGNLVLERANAVTLTELLRLRNGQMRDYVQNLPSKPYKQAVQELHKATGGDREKIWERTGMTVFEHYWQPAFRSLPISLMPHIAKFGEGIKDEPIGKRLRALFGELPAMHNYIEVMARASEDPNRNDKPSDFFDLEMIPIPLAYGHTFLTLDKWMRARLLQPANFIKRNNCTFCASYAELESWLDAA